MRAVFYARYSTDRQRESSIEDQFRNCMRLVKHEGWEVVKRYRDEAISGSTSNRPDYKKMLADADEDLFDILIVDDLSRLSRDDIEMKQVIRRFVFWGIRIIGVSDGYDSDSKGAKVHAGVRGLINEIYLDDLREKTHRGLSGNAIKGLNCGGRSYGYRHIPEEDPNHTDEYGRPVIVAVRREIDKEQARWVLKIFEWYAGGHAPRWIAAELNRLGIPSPRGSTWSGSTIYGDMRKGTGFLNNRLYIGEFVWNRSRWIKDPDSGRQKRLDRPENEWIINTLPELTIIPAPLWKRVKSRQNTQYQKSKAIRDSLHKKARTGAGPKYLFSGLLKCGVCGGNYIIADAYRYGCSKYINQGETVCANSLKVPRKLIEERLLDAIKRDLFTEKGFELFKTEVARILADKASMKNQDQDQARKHLNRIEREIENIANAIKAGIITETTKSELQKAEGEQSRLRQILSGVETSADNAQTSLPDAVAIYHDLVKNFETVTLKQVGRARNQIKALVDGQVTLHPTEQGYLEAELTGDYAGLMALTKNNPGQKTEVKLSMVAGACNCLGLLSCHFEPMFRLSSPQEAG